MRPISYSIFLFFLFIQLCLSAQHLKIKIPSTTSNRSENAAIKSPLQQLPLSLEIPAGGNPNHANSVTVHEPMPFISIPEALAIKAEKLLHKKFNTGSQATTPASRVTPVIDESFE